MHSPAGPRVGGTTTLTTEQRDWITRQGRIARALEAARRRTDGRFSRAAMRSKPAAAATTAARSRDGAAPPPESPRAARGKDL